MWSRTRSSRVTRGSIDTRWVWPLIASERATRSPGGGSEGAGAWAVPARLTNELAAVAAVTPKKPRRFTAMSDNPPAETCVTHGVLVGSQGALTWSMRWPVPVLFLQGLWGDTGR